VHVTLCDVGPRDGLRRGLVLAADGGLPSRRLRPGAGALVRPNILRNVFVQLGDIVVLVVDLPAIRVDGITGAAIRDVTATSEP